MRYPSSILQLYVLCHSEGNRIFSAYFYSCFLNFMFSSVLHIFHKICCKCRTAVSLYNCVARASFCWCGTLCKVILEFGQDGPYVTHCIFHACRKVGKFWSVRFIHNEEPNLFWEIVWCEAGVEQGVYVSCFVDWNRNKAIVSS
jgi:hypothetical protein